MRVEENNLKLYNLAFGQMDDDINKTIKYCLLCTA